MTEFGPATLRHFAPSALAVAAILVTDDGRYLLQHRDDRPDIWFPGFWGAFGGAVDDGEDETEALRRELYEELELRPAALRYFTQISFDFSTMGSDNKYRCYFEATLSKKDAEALRLHEGQDMGLFTGEEILRKSDITPYDMLVLRMHVMRDRVVPANARIG